MTTEEFIRLYPITRTVELAETLGIKPGSVWAKARRLGVRKSDEIISLESSLTNKGRIRSIETREKLRRRMTGKKLPASQREAISLRNRVKSAEKRGITLDKWTPLPRRVIDSSQYIAWRTDVYTRDNYTCQDCGYKGDAHSKAVYAHHILDWANHTESRYDVSNGVTLCFNCHAKRHNWDIIPSIPIECACGCGTIIASKQRWRPRRRFARGHSVRARYLNKVAPTPIPCACGCGTLISPGVPSRPRKYVNGHWIRERWRKYHLEQEQSRL